MVLETVFFTLFFYEIAWISCHTEKFSCIRIVVCGDLVTPPELTGYTPVTEIVYPVFEYFSISLWDDLEVLLLISYDDFLCHDACFHEPLSRDDRLDTTLSPTTKSYLMSVWFCAYEIASGS